ncbi:MAG: hypothetical protein IH851_07000 [Armatimonadetes bacterium]|nr:hypothetical protein [Armatimonadota bacterium]
MNEKKRSTEEAIRARAEERARVHAVWDADLEPFKQELEARFQISDLNELRDRIVSSEELVRFIMSWLPRFKVWHNKWAWVIYTVIDTKVRYDPTPLFQFFDGTENETHRWYIGETFRLTKPMGDISAWLVEKLLDPDVGSCKENLAEALARHAPKDVTEEALTQIIDDWPVVAGVLAVVGTEKTLRLLESKRDDFAARATKSSDVSESDRLYWERERDSRPPGLVEPHMVKIVDKAIRRIKKRLEKRAKAKGRSPHSESQSLRLAKLPEIRTDEFAADVNLLIEKIETGPEGSVTADVAGRHDEDEVGFRIHLRAGMQPGLVNSNESGFHVDGVVFESVGKVSDRFVVALADIYDVRGVRKRMKTKVAFTTIAIEGDPGNIECEPVFFKLFYEEPDGGGYCEIFLAINIPAGQVELKEKDQDNRRRVLMAIAMSSRPR